MNFLAKLCRLCTNNSDTSITLNDSDSNNIIFLNKLNEIAPEILKDSNNELPNGICKSCIVQLNDAYEFRAKCFKSQEILKQYMEQLQNEVHEKESIEYLQTELEENSDQICEDIVDLTEDSDEVCATSLTKEGLRCEENLINLKKNTFITINSVNKQVKNKVSCDNFEETNSISTEYNNSNSYEFVNVDEIEENVMKLEENIISPNNDNNVIDLCNIKNQSNCIHEENIDNSDTITKIEENLCEAVCSDHTYVKNNYLCEICEETFDNELDLKLHKHNEPTNTKVCDNTDNFNSNLIQHIRKHITNKNPYKCRICDKFFKQNNAIYQSKFVQNYISSHSDENQHVCTVCGRAFATILNLKEHIQIHASEKNLKKHVRAVKSTVKLYRCEICKKLFLLKRHLTKHINLVHKNVYNCKICDKVFTQVNNLQTHIRTHTNQNKKRHICKLCDKVFNERENLKCHIRDIHANDKLYSCEICNKTFTNHAYKKRHMLTHTNVKLTCEICEKVFQQKSSLTAHMRGHTNENPYTCQICDRKFTSSSNLKKHIRTHTGETPFKCQLCGKGFKQNEHLKKHIRTHTGEKPCECKICGKHFNDTSSLTKHIRVHTHEKPYICKICDKAYTQSSTLTIHMRTHTNEKPYVCEICSKAFHARNSLNKHVKIHNKYNY